MTVRETLDFAGRSVGVGTRYELLAELSRREKELGIKPDPEIDVLMKATAVAGHESSLVTGYVLKILVLDTCADIMIGDQMRRVLLSSFTALDFWNSGILNMSWRTCTRLFDMF
ncbi:hypothetical protein P3S68_031960 [Capsicum galapagoense]